MRLLCFDRQDAEYLGIVHMDSPLLRVPKEVTYYALLQPKQAGIGNRAGTSSTIIHIHIDTHIRSQTHALLHTGRHRQSMAGVHRRAIYASIVICIISVGRPALVANLHLNTKFCRGTSISFIFAHHARLYIAMPRLNEVIYKAIYIMFFRGLSAHISWHILRIFGLSVFKRFMKRYFANYRFYKVFLSLLKDFRGFESKLTPVIK